MWSISLHAEICSKCPSYRIGDAAYSNQPTKSRIQAFSRCLVGLMDYGRDNLPYQLCTQHAPSWPKLLVAWEWNHFRWVNFYFWIVNARYVTVELSTAQLLHNHYLYYTVFSKHCKEGSLNALYFYFPPETCTGYWNISYVPWIRESINPHVWCIANMTVRSLKLVFTSEGNVLQAFRKLQNVEYS